MSNPVKAAFERRIAVLPVSAILPLRKVSEHTKLSAKYKLIAHSIAEVGIIEPIVVARSRDQKNRYLLLDGHLRLCAITDQGAREVRCLIADDDEAFTYNKRINRLATIQEHYMIVRALDRGVSEGKLAKILNVDLRMIRRRRTLLDGICPEVVEMLKDKTVNPDTFEVLRKMKPMRQVEVAELMNLAVNFTASYAKALLAATRQSDLVHPEKPKKIEGLTSEQMARMEREMAALQQDFKAVESSYGDDVLHLVIASGYLTKLVNNPEIERYLTRHHPEILSQFRAIVAAASIDQPSAVA
jgi:ParB-like chromosome segregation protein Spo0J